MNCVGSPVKHTVQSGAAVVAFGSGLVSACEGQPAKFVVDSKGERGELVVHVDGQLISPCRPVPLMTFNRLQTIS